MVNRFGEDSLIAIRDDNRSYIFSGDFITLGNKADLSISIPGCVKVSKEDAFNFLLKCDIVEDIEASAGMFEIEVDGLETIILDFVPVNYESKYTHLKNKVESTLKLLSDQIKLYKHDKGIQETGRVFSEAEAVSISDKLTAKALTHIYEILNEGPYEE